MTMAPDEWSGLNNEQVDFRKARRKKANLAEPEKEDLLPPHSTEAEQGVLGCILLSPQDSLDACTLKFKDSAEPFFDLRHRVIYESMVGMFTAAQPIDIITLHQALKEGKHIDAVGGLSYLASLPDCTSNPANLPSYLEIVWSKYLLRRVIGTCTEVVTRAYEHQGEVDVLIDEVSHNIGRLAGSAVVKDTVRGAAGLIIEVGSIIDRAMVSRGAISGISSGFTDLDRMTCGFQKQDMIIIAARPSIGKTSVAMNMAVNMAKAGIQVGFHSLEMSASSLMLRAVCSESRVSMNNVRYGQVNDQDLAQIELASTALSKTTLVIDDAGGLSMTQLTIKAGRLMDKFGIKALFIDYLQLLHSTRRHGNAQEETSFISNCIKALAKSLGIPVIVLSQLNRDSENRPDKKPRLSDLRQSGALEQDADVVLLLCHQGVNDGTPKMIVPVVVDVAKNRNGPTGELSLIFMKHLSRFENAAKP